MKGILRYNSKLGIFTLCNASKNNVGKYNCPHTLEHSDWSTLSVEEYRKLPEVIKCQEENAINNPKIIEPLPKYTSEIILKYISNFDKNDVDEEKDVIVIMPTGSGKSAVIHKVTYLNTIRNNGNVLVILPTNSLESQYENVGGMNEYSGYYFVKYKALDDIEKIKKLIKDKNIKSIVFDEGHRALAKTWEKPCNELREIMKENGNICYFFTATPFRNDENGKDLREEIGEPVVEITLEEAVEQGVYSNIPDYYRYVGDDDIEEIKKLKKESEISTTRVLKKDTINGLNGFLIGINHDKEENENKIINNHIEELFSERKENGLKIVVFCETIESSSETRDRINNIIKSSNILKDKNVKHIIYNSEEKGEDEFVRSKFIDKTYTSKSDNYDIEIVYAVNLFDEGLHCDNVDMGILLNSTKSNIRYTQRIGRFFGKMEKRARIIDFTRSSYNVSHPIDWNRINNYCKNNENHEILHDQEGISQFNEVLYRAKKELKTSGINSNVYYDDYSKNQFFSVGEVVERVGTPKNCFKSNWTNFVKYSIEEGKSLDWIREQRKTMVGRNIKMSSLEIKNLIGNLLKG